VKGQNSGERVKVYKQNFSEEEKCAGFNGRAHISIKQKIKRESS